MDDFQEKYHAQQEEYKKRLQEENAHIILNLENALKKRNNIVEDFLFSHPVGLVAITKEPLDLLIDIPRDKDGLYSWIDLEKRIPLNSSVGFFKFDNFYFMVSHYFRRSYSRLNNYTPLFVEQFYKLNKSNIDAYLSLDDDAVRIDNPSLFVELDAWFGAKFNSEINEIPDGIVKYKPPVHEDKNINLFFKDNYSLDIKWETKGNIKTFQLLEFKNENINLVQNGSKIYPVRYVHAEYNLSGKFFQHFDGAIHFYSETHYFEKREKDINYDLKSFKGEKPISKKLFKLNGEITIEDWSNLTSHFLHGNPLIVEYFTGEYPQFVKRFLERF